MRCVLCAVLRGRSVGLPPPRSSFSFLWFSQALSFALLSDSSKVPPLSLPHWRGLVVGDRVGRRPTSCVYATQ